MSAKERPILFSAPMVLALLAGTKTQTRRLVKPQPGPDDVEPGSWPNDPRRQYVEDIEPMPCPYGVAGDRLWVKETWRTDEDHDLIAPSDLPSGAVIVYEADGVQLEPNPFGKGRPSIFMMRHMSRLTLDVTGVRVERLQDITAADAKAEGLRADTITSNLFHCSWPEGGSGWTEDSRLAYRSLWETINGADSWALNPWVWVIEFRVASVANARAALLKARGGK